MSSLFRSIVRIAPCVLAVACVPAETQSGDPGPDELELTLENIYRNGGGAGRAVPSPDGRTIAVSGRTADGAGIHLLSVGGGSPTFWVSGGSQTWSPDGGRLAYTAGGALHVVRTGSSEPVTVADDLAGIRAPAWSPDGSMLAFYSVETGFQDIWIVPADGSAEPRVLTDGAAEGDDGRFTPAWSPDGTRIAYISNEADWWHDDVWLVDVDSGTRHKVSSRLMASSSPVWSPGRLAHRADGDG